MTPGQPDPAVLRRHLLALDEAVQHLRRHAGRPLALLQNDADERWAVERGLLPERRRHAAAPLLHSGLDDFVAFARFVEPPKR
jgi:hypothetical protein